jgi:hypothetical protein
MFDGPACTADRARRVATLIEHQPHLAAACDEVFCVFCGFRVCPSSLWLCVSVVVFFFVTGSGSW